MEIDGLEIVDTEDYHYDRPVPSPGQHTFCRKLQPDQVLTRQGHQPPSGTSEKTSALERRQSLALVAYRPLLTYLGQLNQRPRLHLD